MNDLIELREGWGQPEPPSPGAYLAARAALLQQAAATGAAGPVPAGAGSQSQRLARGHRRWAGWLTAGASLAAAAAAAVTVATVMAGPSGAPPAAAGRGGAPAHSRLSPAAVSRLPARQILLAAATSAAAAPASTGTYWHVKQAVADGHGVLSPLEDWYTHNGAAYQRAPNGEVYRQSPGCGFAVGGRWLTYRQIQQLPTDPAALKAWIVWSGSRSGWQAADLCSSHLNPAPPVAAWTGNEFSGSGVAVVLIQLLYQVPAPPALRAAAFRALASLPEVRKLGGTDGGVQLAVQFPPIPASKFRSGKKPAGDNGVYRLVLDPATFALRAESGFGNTTKILTAGWTGSRPPVVPISRVFPPKPVQAPPPGSS